MNITLLADDYFRATSTRFTVSAPISPFSACMRLGDYGPYHQGKIDWQGNIFTDFDLDPEEFVTVDPYVDTQVLLVSSAVQETQKICGVSSNGNLYSDISLRFGGNRGFLLHFSKIRNELFLPDLLIDHCVQALIKKRRWRQNYRMVWQRTLAQQTCFGYTSSLGGKLTIRLEQYMFLQELKKADALPYILDYNHHMNLDSWFQPYTSTPAVNLCRLKTNHGSESTYTEGFGEDELSGFSANTLIHDNRPS
ncbi:MAG: hypothetical protein AAF587_28050 [Bacteroidota bacterium]